MKTVGVGMSGGVDSSVAALLLKEAGYKVIGLFMKNWEEKDGSGVCTSATDFDDANRVAEKLQIPLIPLNFSEEYWERVFKEFLNKLEAGLTPNPDVLCNREIKFDCLLEKARALGADFLATGHYCQTENGQLLKGADPLKDQSYFLHLIEGKLLSEVLFPIGHLPKAEVRALAKKSGLPTHAKKDSTGICFIGKRDFKSFISDYIPYHKGQFEDTQGRVIGEHAGCAYYTIGQRKGLGIGGRGEAWFVVGKDIGRNVVIIEQGTDHPALYASTLIASNPHFIGSPPAFPLRCTAKIRYRQLDEPCLVEETEEGLRVIFDQPQRAITPGQSVVFYNGPLCLGGAHIDSLKK